MNILLFTLLTVAVTLSLVGAAPEATCKEFVSSLTKKQLGGISSCSKTMKFKNPKEKAAKMNCILKCVMIKEAMLDGAGQFVDGAGFDALIEAWIPSNLKDALEPKFKFCKESSAKDLDNSDEFCKSYDPLIKCFLDLMSNACK